MFSKSENYTGIAGEKRMLTGYHLIEFYTTGTSVHNFDQFASKSSTFQLQQFSALRQKDAKTLRSMAKGIKKELFIAGHIQTMQ